jgi:hypothetical protein
MDSPSRLGGHRRRTCRRPSGPTPEDPLTGSLAASPTAHTPVARRTVAGTAQEVPMTAAPRRSFLPRRVLAVLALAGLLATAGAAPVAARDHPYARDVYFAAGYERQIDSRTCTAAATAMMLNFIAGHDLNLGQMYILRWEQTRDALSNAVQRGSDPLGWSRAVTYFSSRTGRPTTYAWEAYGSERSALRRAARQIAATGKPVGLLVAHGTHAMVMTGFSASRNPLESDDFDVQTVWVSDPNGAAHRSYAGYSTPLDTYRETDATPYYDAAWYNRYVLNVPQG